MNRRRFLQRSAVSAPVLLLGQTAIAAALGGILIGLVIGLVIVIVGIIVVIYLIKMCQNIKPRELPPEAIGYTLRHGRIQMLDDECQNAATTHAAGSPRAGGTLEVQFALDGTPTISRLPGTFTRDESAAAARRLGLDPDANSASHYTQPIPLEESPITIQTPAGQPWRIELAGPVLRTVALQTSPDLEHWTTVFTARLPVDHRVKYYDTDSESALFYRLVPV